MLNLVIFGGPGSGKGTQSERIAERYGLYHISTGELLREHIAKGTDLGKVANSYISQGMLIPDKLMVKVLEHELDSHKDETARGVIFDGFPRTLAQADSLAQLLRSRGTKVNAVIGLEVTDEELTRRMLKRGEETGRADDNERTIANRLAVYHKQTSPLKDYYTANGQYIRIPGEGSIEDVFGKITTYLDVIQ